MAHRRGSLGHGQQSGQRLGSSMQFITGSRIRRHDGSGSTSDLLLVKKAPNDCQGDYRKQGGYLKVWQLSKFPSAGHCIKWRGNSSSAKSKCN
jgi:hypothetical protein